MKPEKVIFFGQVVASVLGKKDIYLLRNEKGKLKTRILACTDSEAIEIWAKFEFFYKAWEADMKVFYSAFVQKNHLYQKPDASEDEEDEEEDTPLTPQERAKLYKMASMMEGIDRHHYTKQLK